MVSNFSIYFFIYCNLFFIIKDFHGTPMYQSPHQGGFDQATAMMHHPHPGKCLSTNIKYFIILYYVL
jgi:hypothetical protein